MMANLCFAHFKFFNFKFWCMISMLYKFVSRFVGELLKLLVCKNEKFGPQIQKNVKELVGHEMSPALYPILFDQIKFFVEKFFDSQGQVRSFSYLSFCSCFSVFSCLKLSYILSAGCSCWPQHTIYWTYYFCHEECFRQQDRSAFGTSRRHLHRRNDAGHC